MDAFFERLLIQASTFDEIFSDQFQSQPGQKEHTDIAAKRLAAWCRASASGDWSLFSKRLKRDQLEIETVLQKFSSVRFAHDAPPEWVTDAKWILNALESSSQDLLKEIGSQEIPPIPFEDILHGLVEKSVEQVLLSTQFKVEDYFSQPGWLSLHRTLLKQLSDIAAPVLFSLYIKQLKTEAAIHPHTLIEANNNGIYQAFIKELQAQSLRRLFNEKPVLLRLLATVTRQWIRTISILLDRIRNDFTDITKEFVSGSKPFFITNVTGELSDLHNFGYSVLVLEINSAAKVVYKPKDLGLDLQWFKLIEKLNALESPVQLKAVKALTRQGYGWTEYIHNAACSSEAEFPVFFKKAGAWLAIFHLFASGDMHYENLIASGCDPVPVDLEMILMATTPEKNSTDPDSLALNDAKIKMANSVLSVGMLPAYTRLPDNEIIDMGGLNGRAPNLLVGSWQNINTDAMCWVKEKKEPATIPNIPRANGIYAKLGDYLHNFIDGFERYSTFILDVRQRNGVEFFVADFKNLPVRKLIRSTRFYTTLMQRLKDYRTMDDGITWSVQADFLARMANWDDDEDLIWPLQQSERRALLALNIPHFTTPSDGQAIEDTHGKLLVSPAMSGIDRAIDRIAHLNLDDIAWQKTVIELSTATVTKSKKYDDQVERRSTRELAQHRSADIAQIQLEQCAEKISEIISNTAFLNGNSAAWVGLDCLGDSEVAQLVALGPDLYNGTGGIALFLAAHWKLTGREQSKTLAYRAVQTIRHQMRQSSAARWARSLGIGGAIGLGSIVYALATLSELLNDQALLDDAEYGVSLFSPDLIAADTSYDVIAGSAGAILGLLKLHKLSGSASALHKAINCAEHLLQAPRSGEVGARSWVAAEIKSSSPLTGMSHGAAGFAYALIKLYEQTDRDDFLEAAKECLKFEKQTFSITHKNWADLRNTKPQYVCQWCHGALGIGLARIGIARAWSGYREEISEDINYAIDTATAIWPNKNDSLCCGSMGSVEFMNEAGMYLHNQALSTLAHERLIALIGDSQVNNGFKFLQNSQEFNLGLFRGVAGVGYTALRQLDRSLPNVLLWQ